MTAQRSRNLNRDPHGLGSHAFSQHAWDLGLVQLLLQIRFELRQLRSNGALSLVDSGQNVGRLQTVTRDAQNRCLVGMDAVLPIELAGRTNGYPAGCLG